jgi:hypothetical protein
MLLWGHPLMKLFVLIVSPSVSFLFEITIINILHNSYQVSKRATPLLQNHYLWAFLCLKWKNSTFSRSMIRISYDLKINQQLKLMLVAK